MARRGRPDPPEAPGRATAPAPPTRAEVRRVAATLRRAYRVDKAEMLADDPLASLVRAILSQHTADRNRDAAFAALRERFGTWDAVADAPVEAIDEAIHPANHHRTKAGRIKRLLSEIRTRFGAISLDALRTMPTGQALEALTGFEGVGPKSAAIVLLFSLGRPVMPVDVHVYRVAWRLGWVPPGVSIEGAHRLLGALIPPDLVYDLHVGLWEHGRVVCRPTPRCIRCVIYADCRYERKTAPAPDLAPAWARGRARPPRRRARGAR